MLLEEVARLQVCAEEYSATSLFSLPSYNGGYLLVTENSCLHSTNAHVVVRLWHRHQLKVVNLYLLPVLWGASRSRFFLRDWHLEHGRVRPGIANDIQMLNPDKSGYFSFGIPTVTQQNELFVLTHNVASEEYHLPGHDQLADLANPHSLRHDNRHILEPSDRHGWNEHDERHKAVAVDETSLFVLRCS